jgi:hypothetical protein
MTVRTPKKKNRRRNIRIELIINIDEKKLKVSEMPIYA